MCRAQYNAYTMTYSLRIMGGGFCSRTVNNGNMIGADARTFKKCDYYSLLTNWFEEEMNY